MGKPEKVDVYAIEPIDPGVPDDGITFTLPLAQCMLCRHFKIVFHHPTPPNSSARIKGLIRDDDIRRIRCAEGRLRYADGEVKEYQSRQLLRTPPTRTGDCPGFELSDETDLLNDVLSMIEFVEQND